MPFQMNQSSNSDSSKAEIFVPGCGTRPVLVITIINDIPELEVFSDSATKKATHKISLEDAIKKEKNEPKSSKNSD